MHAPNPTDVVEFELALRRRARTSAARPGWSARLRARVFAHRMDVHVERCVPPGAGSTLAAHHHRLSTRRERTELARRLELALRDAVEGPDALRPRRPVHRTEVLRHRAAIEAIRARLEGPTAVRDRGVARLRLLLADRRGPLYASGRGSLNAALRGVLAAL